MRVSTVNLESSGLVGYISPVLGNLSSLEVLDMSNNSFHGVIPDLGQKLSNLKELHLWGNQLIGPIPTSLGNCSKLKFLDLGLNNLNGSVPLQLGKIPKREPFRNLTAPPFKVEPRLCGEGGFLYPGCPIAGSPGEAPEGSPGGLRDLHNLFKYMIYAIPSLVIYCLYIFFLYKYTFPKKNVEPSMQFPHPRISYKELSTATNGFDKANLLGVGSVGSVYKGVLDAGTLIAVKVLNLENEAAHKSFNTECQVLSKTRHRNIIKAITSCSNLDFKGLVFEFMANGNLERHLHCAGNCNFGDVCKMNLQTRLQIATDVARGLAYLHHDCSIQVVHCDLKPNNILLDFNMTTRIADFGNAQILSENSMISFSASTTLKGAPGYIAPEYGVGARISTKGDVYSYGILLLEMLTGKRPTHQMFADGLSLRMWVSMAFTDRISEVVDDSLFLCNGSFTNTTCSCLIQLIRVALLCSKDSPKDRPSMAEIVELLESIEDMFEGRTMDSIYQYDLYQMVNSKRWARDLALKDQSTSTFQSTS
ncbi:putative receptor-like protein kinase At3g47110 isoform X3 [Cryptomeria japonica]|uniref:putative receptor-like protein kinase At3g47110 isoform X3 n=1 Tax=Cryptomeria japonica TaxID=3369 RepID=UPI0027DA177E|nr:putative receptor-like protein kinase At3g47110 isoform X3 [Cryptomeria japonica]